MRRQSRAQTESSCKKKFVLSVSSAARSFLLLPALLCVLTCDMRHRFVIDPRMLHIPIDTCTPQPFEQPAFPSQRLRSPGKQSPLSSDCDIPSQCSVRCCVENILLFVLNLVILSQYSICFVTEDNFLRVHNFLVPMQYSVCFAVESSYQAGVCQHTFFAAKVHGHPEQYCVDVTVQRCRYCPANNGESLVDIAHAWGGSSTSYLQVCRSSSS